MGDNLVPNWLSMSVQAQAMPSEWDRAASAVLRRHSR
jgi:hypothetical protein